MRTPVTSPPSGFSSGSWPSPYSSSACPKPGQAAPAAGDDDGGAASAKPGVVSINVSGFSFEDLDPRTTPNLWVMMKGGQIGTITPRSVRATSCPVDGWLGLGSGRRAADEPRDQCREPASPLDGWVADWDVYAQVARGDNYDASLGALAEAVPDIRAFGNGAAIAAASPSGHVENWSPVGSDLGADVANRPRTVSSPSLTSAILPRRLLAEEPRCSGRGHPRIDRVDECGSAEPPRRGGAFPSCSPRSPTVRMRDRRCRRR